MENERKEAVFTEGREGKTCNFNFTFTSCRELFDPEIYLSDVHAT